MSSLLPSRLRADGLACRGAEMLRMGRLPEALSCCVDALQAHPQSAEAAAVMGTVFFGLGQRDRAYEAWRHAVELDPQHLGAWKHLGNGLCEMKRYDEAIPCFRAVLNIDPGDAYALNYMGIALQQTSRINAALDAYRQAIHAGSSVAYHNLLYALYFHAGSDATAILEEHRRWDATVASPSSAQAARTECDGNAQRPLRLGYVGAQFRDHCQTYFTLPLLRHHDREQFKIHLYSDTERIDNRTLQIREHADVWHDCRGMSDEALSRQIRRDGIDILIDLTLHMGGSRLLAFARRPAPVQVCWLGYPGTTGLSVMDYRITDPHLDPPGQHDEYYTETSIRLPDTFWCFEPMEGPRSITPPPSLARSGQITFGCFNNFSKLNTFTLDRWACVLREIDGSTIMILVPQGPSRDAVRGYLDRCGIEASRVTFVSELERTAYLDQYSHIDIALDTFPYNGHTTTLDTLWMGVPVVTRAGQTPVSRGTMSLLNNLGLQDLVTHSDETFVATAVGLARDQCRLSNLRVSLRSRMEASPLMDSAAFARHMEAAYREMWTTCCARSHPHTSSDPSQATWRTA